MASTSQHRCVFVGNIPYDATEEQLRQICEEVGPVVSFRLVTDRETGKPKGYGFCEYKDEETALSARRNLLGYEINGRQLRIDFAENDKGPDRNREQGRGGPGITANSDPQKPVGGPAILGDSSHQHPIGLSLATAAASIMAGALGGAQVGNKANPNGLYNQAGLGGDPLTLHLAKMSRSHLNEIFYELKVMAAEDKELARQLLLANPQLPKALFQAQIMLGMVTQEMLYMSNIRQGGSFLHPSSQDSQQGRMPAFQAAPGLPPIAQNKMQLGMVPKVQEGQASITSQSSLVTNQVSAAQQPHTLSRVQMPHVAPIRVQQPPFPAHSGVPKLLSIAPDPVSDLSAIPQFHVATSSSLNQKTQVPLLQHLGRNETANPGHNRQLVNPNATVPSLLTRPPVLDPGFQKQPMISNIPESMRKDSDRSGQTTGDANWVGKLNNYSNLISGPLKARTVHDNSEPLGRPSKLVNLDDGKSTPLPLAGLNGAITSGSGPSQVIGMGSTQIPKPQNQQSEQQVSQMQLPPDVESALLQQVMNLTPEQLSLLPPDQQQQVIQLQQMLR